MQLRSTCPEAVTVPKELKVAVGLRMARVEGTTAAVSQPTDCEVEAMILGGARKIGIWIEPSVPEVSEQQTG